MASQTLTEEQKCFIYLGWKNTSNKPIIEGLGTYEGIPQNLILNLCGSVVRNFYLRVHVVSEYNFDGGSDEEIEIMSLLMFFNICCFTDDDYAVFIFTQESMELW